MWCCNNAITVTCYLISWYSIEKEKREATKKRKRRKQRRREKGGTWSKWVTMDMSGGKACCPIAVTLLILWLISSCCSSWLLSEILSVSIAVVSSVCCWFCCCCFFCRHSRSFSSRSLSFSFAPKHKRYQPRTSFWWGRLKLSEGFGFVNAWFSDWNNKLVPQK